jgi:hypothetical protein
MGRVDFFEMYVEIVLYIYEALWRDKMNISPHTFELSLRLKDFEYKDLRSIAYARAEDSHRIFQDTGRSEYWNVHIDEALVSSGIRVEYHDNFNRYVIKLIVNPSKVLGGDDIPKLWKTTDRNIKELIRELKLHIADYFGSKYKLNDFKLTRIDYTANIDVGSRENVSNYIKILHAHGRVKGFAPKYKKSNKRIDKSLSFDLQGRSLCAEFSAYDKEAASRKKMAKDILRVEVRLMKLADLRGSVSEQIRFLSKASRETFMGLFQRIVPRGDYYIKKETVTLIEENIAAIVPDLRARANMLDKMTQLLELIPKKKSLLLAQKALNYRHIDRVMETFAALNLSPVTIPKSMGLKHLDSLYRYFE